MMENDKEDSVQKRILNYLKSNGVEKSTVQIAEHLGMSANSARYHLMRLHVEGLVKLRIASKRVWLWRAESYGGAEK